MTGCQELEKGNVGVENVDGDKTTGHMHYNPDIPEHQNAIDRIVRESAAGEESRISRDKAEQLLKEELENAKREISIEDAADNVIEEMNQQFRGKNL